MSLKKAFISFFKLKLMFCLSLTKPRLKWLKTLNLAVCSFLQKKTTNITLFLIGLFILLWFLSSNLGLYINTSNSLTRGLYLRSDLVDLAYLLTKQKNLISNSKQIKQTKYQKYDLVAFCPPNLPIFYEAQQRGYIGISLCAGNLGIMLKQIVATYGDVISINKEGVLVNNHLLKYSKPLDKDAQNRLLPKIKLINYKLKINEVLVMTNINPYSFDSRYFGVINTNQIKHTIKLIKAW